MRTLICIRSRCRCDRRSAGPAWTSTLAGVTFCLLLACSPVAGEPPAAVARDVRVEAALEEAEKLHTAGDSEGALAVLRKASGMVKREKGATHPDLVPILDLAGLILFEQQKLDEAEGPLAKAVTLREPLLADEPGRFEIEQASTLLLLGKLHASAGRIDAMVDSLVKAVVMLDTALGAEHEQTAQARSELVRAVDLFTAQLGPDHEATIKANEELAKVHEALGDFASATTTWRARYDGELKRSGAGAGETLRAAAAVGRALALSGRAAEAIGLESQAAAAAEADPAVDRAALVELLRTLATLQTAAEDYSPAEATLLQARDIDVQLGGDDCLGVALDDIGLARLAALRGDFDPAAESFTRATARFEQLARDGDAIGPPGLRLAAEVLREAGHAPAAIPLYRLALETDERLAGPQDPDVGEDQLGLARCLLAAGDVEAARPLVTAAARTFRRQLGTSHRLTLAAVAQQAVIAVRDGQADAAVAEVRRLLDRRVPRESPRDDEELALLLEETTALLSKAGRAAEAGDLTRDFLKLRARQFGDEHPHVADAYVHVAAGRQGAGDWAAARDFFSRALAIREATLGPDHPDVAAVLLPMARALRGLKQNREAAAALRRALAIWDSLLGAGHPVTVTTLRELARATLAAGDRQEAVALMEQLLAAYDANPETPTEDTRRLLGKLAEVKQELGDDDAARRLVRRAVAMEQAEATAAPSAESVRELAELAWLQRRVGDGDAAEATLELARAIAAKLPDADAVLKQIESIATRP